MRRAPEVMVSWCRFLSPVACIFAVFVLVVSGSTALAQEPTRDRSKYGSMRLGPFYLSLSAPFAVGVDNNVYNAPEGTSDQSASITPTLKVVLPLIRRARIRGSGGIVPQYFHRERSQRYTDLFGDVRGEVDLGPLTAYGGIGGGRYRQRFTLEIDDRLLRHQKSHIFGATLHLGKRVTVSGSQSTVTATFDPEASVDGRPVSQSLDRRSVTRRAELSVPLTRKTSLLPFVELIEDRFLQASPGLKPTVDSQRYGAALSFSELAFLTGTLAAGVRHFGASEGVTPYNGPFLSVSLTSPFVIRTRLVVSANRDVTYSGLAPSSGTIRNTYVISAYRSEVLFELPLKLQGRLFGGYLESRYLAPEPGVSDPVARPRRDHGWIEGGALLRHLGRHLSLGVRVQHENRTSSVAARAYDAMAYGLAGEASF
jgi:hypothetical protein